MTPFHENDFARAHEFFNQGHAEQRARLMTALTQATQSRPKKASWPRIPLPLRLTAAGLLIAATAALLSLSQGERAYGIEGLRERLLTIRSLHLKGWLYKYTKTDAGKVPLAFPTESFFERPYRQYRTGYSFSGDGPKLKVISGVFVSDGEQSMLIDKENKTATFTPANKLESELMVEGSIQQRLFEELGKGDLGAFEKVRVERINDVVCDVYELKSDPQSGGRHVDGPDIPLKFCTCLWLNPQDGMPVRVVEYMIDATGVEELFFEWTEIGINVDPPEGMFSFRVPDGYESIEAPRKNDRNAMATLNGGGGMTGNGKSAAVSSGVALNIDDKAVLYCWAVKTTGKEGPKWFDGQPDFSLEDVNKRPCEEITLHTDDTGEHQARWSLIIPRDRRPLGNASLSMIYRLGRSTSTMGVSPLEYNTERLTGIVEEVQRRTLPPSNDAAEIWTLEELRQKLTEVR